MRLLQTLVLVCCCVTGMAQDKSTSNDEELAVKARALYDAPFRRELISFDCGVQFDWNKHFTDLLGSVPPTARSLVDRLQTVPHRVFVDRTGATSSSNPRQPNLEDVAHATELEQGFVSILSSGLNAWLPSSTNVLLPMAPTKSSWEINEAGYKVKMIGPGVSAQLLLSKDMRLTSGVTMLPQPMRFTTDFASGPDGFLLTSLRTGSTTDPSAASEANFSYTYQLVQGFEIPLQITVTSATAETWRYSLTDCHVSKGIAVRALPVH
jgi:hypothetical protein